MHPTTETRKSGTRLNAHWPLFRPLISLGITLAELVDWAEQSMMEEDFSPDDLETIRDLTSRIGLADMREFGLTWEDCEDYLGRLGYRTKVDIIQTA